ncbi:MAG: hypothetical protein Q4D95_01385, partial [Peptoniphilus sp.]|nr:hypothetical protein [Peptoniphilus sp.]
MKKFKFISKLIVFSLVFNILGTIVVSAQSLNFVEPEYIMEEIKTKHDLHEHFFDEDMPKRSEEQAQRGPGGAERAVSLSYEEEGSLELSEVSMALRAPRSAPVEISSWEDLKDEILGVGKQTNPMYETKRLFLKGNNYVLKDDIEIDLSDPYFDDKEEYIKNGILSFESYRLDFPGGSQVAVGEDFKFDGGGHSVTIKAGADGYAKSLFGCIVASEIEIKDINLEFNSDVYGQTFADLIHAFKHTEANDYSLARGVVKGISVKVAGDVVPKIEFDKDNNYSLNCTKYAGTYQGAIAAGFAIAINQCHIEDIEVDITGNVGSATAHQLTDEEKEFSKYREFSSGAFGFMFHAESGWMVRDGLGGRSWDELFKNGNYEVLRDRGYIENVVVNIGGSVIATGYNNVYSSGFMHCCAEKWVDGVEVDIAGDIKATAQGGNNSLYGNRSYDDSYATGFAEGIETLMNSQLTVNNIILDISDDYCDDLYENGKKNNLAMLTGMGDNEGLGYIIRILNNKIKIKGKLEGKGPIHIVASAVYENMWNSSGERGVDWMQFFEDNHTEVGEVYLETLRDNTAQYYGVGRQFRTGALDLSYAHNQEKKPLEQSFAKNNTLTVGKLSVVGTGQGGVASVYPSFYIASDVKNNEIKYGDVSIDTDEVYFEGLGDLRNYAPSVDNSMVEVTEKNNVEFGNISITAREYANISLMAGEIVAGKTLKDNTLRAKNIDVNVTSKESLYFGGLANENGGSIENCHLFVEDIDIKTAGRIYFGLGAALNHRKFTENGQTFYEKGSIKDSTVLVDNDIKIDAGGNAYAGIFAGYAKEGEFYNCHAQLNGDFIRDINKVFGAFAGWLTEAKVENSSVLMLNDYAPFVNTMNGGILDTVANYSSMGSFKYYTGMLASGKNVTIKNSTYLVDKTFEYTDGSGQQQVKDNENSPMYRADNVSAESGNNYIVIVGKDENAEYNRVAYAVEERDATADEMADGVRVFAKGGEPVGKINIAKRDFQDKYWGSEAEPYEIGDQEKDFAYVNRNPDNIEISILDLRGESDGTANGLGLAGALVQSDGSRVGLLNYYRRITGVSTPGGPIYDLLGIKAISKEPDPEPNPDPNPDPN